MQKILLLRPFLSEKESLTQQTRCGEELSNEIELCAILGHELDTRTEVDDRKGDGQYV